MNMESMYELAVKKFDAMNALDPRQLVIDGKTIPHECFFAENHTKWVQKLNPMASKALLLAARSQHICRWEIPRQSYSMNRVGYLKWRSDLKKFHAEKAGAILQEIGFDSAFVARVQDLNLKKNLKSDPECQTLEDALCLTFMQYQFDELIANTEQNKMLKIVKKTWNKMSEQAHNEALKLDFSNQALEIINKALMADH